MKRKNIVLGIASIIYLISIGASFFWKTWIFFWIGIGVLEVLLGVTFLSLISKRVWEWIDKKI